MQHLYKMLSDTISDSTSNNTILKNVLIYALLLNEDVAVVRWHIYIKV